MTDKNKERKEAGGKENAAEKPAEDASAVKDKKQNRDSRKKARKMQKRRNWKRRRELQIHLRIALAAVLILAAGAFAIFGAWHPFAGFSGRNGAGQMASSGETAQEGGTGKIQSESENAVREAAAASSLSEEDAIWEDTGTEEAVTILGTGDNIIHERLYQNAEVNGGYDFTPMYRRVKRYVQQADIATINQEGPLATAIGSPAGYPSFNTPVQAADALADTGFDLLNVGNNHINDMGEDGILATLDYLDSRNIPYTGAYRSQEDEDSIRVVEKNGIRVAFVSFVEMLNRNLSSSGSCKIILLSDTAAVQKYIEAAKAQADLVVVHVHWGTENEVSLTETQKTMAQNMVNWGADIIFGNHPHLLQPLTILTRQSDGAKCPVMYSFGNFVSGQKQRAQLISGMLGVTAVKDADSGKVSIQSMKFVPVVTHYEGDRNNVQIYPLSEYSDALARTNGVKQFDGAELTMEYIRSVVSQAIPAAYLDQTGKVQ